MHTYKQTNEQKGIKDKGRVYPLPLLKYKITDKIFTNFSCRRNELCLIVSQIQQQYLKPLCKHEIVDLPHTCPT
jgi:hypothetical protein